jgi:hypothetical protein
MALSGVLCLEAEWHQDLRSPDTVRPVIEFFTSTAAAKPIPLIYRQVLSKADIALCIERWRRSRYKGFELLYLAAHGKPGKLDLWKGEGLTLEEIGTLLKGVCKGKTVLFGSCATMRVPEERVTAFLKVTGARAVAGYVKSPSWAESTALDLIAMEAIRNSGSPRQAWKWMRKNCEGLVNLYGFTMHFA